MPFIPHTKDDVKAMLAAIGVASINNLFDEIPAELCIAELPELPDALSECEALRLLNERLQQPQQMLSFIGAGAYEHHIPAAVWDLTMRGEFLTAYTPYQAEASQGTLQLLYEYQTMMAKLTGMDASNASLYDGATATAEAILMACRVKARNKTAQILIPTTVHPRYRDTARTIVNKNNIEIIDVPCCNTEGTIITDALQQYPQATAIVIQQPNFFGCLEDVDTLTQWAHQQNTLVIACVNPTSLALLKEPGQWGDDGADITVGEGQPLGVPLANGGPYFGFITCKQALLRQMPGRICGRTNDTNGKVGYTLTLQAREQHIRRAKATSNICTNQGLLVTAATIYLSLLGETGLQRVAQACYHNTHELVNRLTAIPGVELMFSAPFFHEVVLRLSRPVDEVLKHLQQHHIHGGYALGQDYPELENCLLICATETKTAGDIQQYVKALSGCL